MKNNEYGRTYYQNYSSDSDTGYEDREVWFPHFCTVADRIIADFHPKTVLDAGCAYGYLVEALRARDVEAYGIDISSYAISQIAKEIQPYCFQGSLVEPFPEGLPAHFDLITHIEVIEHVREEQAKAVLKNLCEHTDTLLFSSTPDGIDDPTHLNVQLPEYWAARFAQLGFFRQMNYSPNYISGSAVCYQRGGNIASVVEDYERYCRQIRSKGKGKGFLYFDTGNGFSEKERHAFFYEDDVPISLRMDLPHVRAVRLMVSAAKGCVIRGIELMTADSLCDIKETNGILVGDCYFFPTEFPYVAFEFSGLGISFFEVSARITCAHSPEVLSCFLKIQREFQYYQEKIQTAKETMEERVLAYERRLDSEREQYAAEVSDALEAANELRGQILPLQREAESLEELLEQKERDVQALQKEIGDYSNLVSYERAQQAQSLAECTAQHDEYRKMYLEISNAFWWRITKLPRLVTGTGKKVLHKLLHNPLTRNIKKTLVLMRQYGLRITLGKIWTRITGKQGGLGVPVQLDQIAALPQACTQTLTVQELYKDTANPIDPIPTIIVNESAKRLNLVTDSIERESLLGGVATALIVATYFAQKNGYELRIITRRAPTNPLNYENIIRLSGISPASKVSYYSDYDRGANRDKDFRLEITPEDVFFATSWWSAAAILKTTLRKRFFYIIQEVETFFYNHGGEHALCGEIMKNENIDFIINSHYLFDYFQKNDPHIAQNGVYFEPAFPLALYQPKGFEKKSAYRLFFYARPNNPRNLFRYGIRMLDAAISRGILDTNIWEICFAGQDVGPVRFSNGHIAKDMGQMTWQEYAGFLQTVDLALCLMYTPHPSYPPYDAACSGSVVLSNRCMNKTSFPQCANVLLTDLQEDQFLGEMQRAIALAQDSETREKQYAQSQIPRDWKQTLERTMKFMEDHI